MPSNICWWLRVFCAHALASFDDLSMTQSPALAFVTSDANHLKTFGGQQSSVVPALTVYICFSSNFFTSSLHGIKARNKYPSNRIDGGWSIHFATQIAQFSILRHTLHQERSWIRWRILIGHSKRNSKVHTSTHNGVLVPSEHPREPSRGTAVFTASQWCRSIWHFKWHNKTGTLFKIHALCTSHIPRKNWPAGFLALSPYRLIALSL